MCGNHERGQEFAQQKSTVSGSKSEKWGEQKREKEGDERVL